MKPLNRLLMSDVKRMWRQGLAISSLMACGVATFVMSTSTMHSLKKSQAKYYADYQFGDVFVQLQRAPSGLAARLADIPGVARVEARVVRNVILDVPNMSAPASCKLVSFAHDPASSLNGIALLQGRLPNPSGRVGWLPASPLLKPTAFGPAISLM